jgi:hypothetical protein
VGVAIHGKDRDARGNPAREGAHTGIRPNASGEGMETLGQRKLRRCWFASVSGCACARWGLHAPVAETARVIAPGSANAAPAGTAAVGWKIGKAGVAGVSARPSPV